MGDLQRDVERLEKALEKVQQLVRKIKSETEEKGEPSDSLQTKLLVAYAVREAGGVVSQEKLRELWERYLGKKPQGLGGMFKGNRGLVVLDGGKVGLSDGAGKLLKEHEEWLKNRKSELEKAVEFLKKE